MKTFCPAILRLIQVPKIKTWELTTLRETHFKYRIQHITLNILKMEASFNQIEIFQRQDVDQESYFL